MTSLEMGSPRRRPALRHPRRRRKLLLTITILVILIFGIAVWSTQNYLWRFSSPHANSHPRALVIDQLSLNYPDPSFVANLTNALTVTGYSVDYSGPSSTAVDSFKQLPGQGYDLVIIRAHEGSSQSIITTESYSKSQYISDQLQGRLVPAQVESGPIYFALTPGFVRQSMNGRFPGSTIIVMGCAALQGTQDLAIAFLDKGAKYFVGWDGPVSIIHTDTSTVGLARLLSNGKSLPEATDLAGGSDPVYGARLRFLDWNSLVQSRVSSLLSELVVWVTLTAMVVIGPMAVFAVPRLVSMLDHVRERSRSRGRKNASRQTLPASKES